MRYRTLAVVLLLLASMMGAVFLIAEETGADAPIAPTTRYVSPAGSTYSSIQDAVDDAVDGDTIIVANGTYSENVQISTSNLTIMGNSTKGVNVTGSGVMTFYLGSVTNVTITNMNISSTNSQAMRVYDSDNITLMGLTLWSDGGTDGCLYIDSSENVTADLDWFTFTPFVVHSEGDNNPAIKLYSTKDIYLLFVDISTLGDTSHGVATFTENTRVLVVYSSIMATGANSDSFHCLGELLMMASGFMEMHGDDFIDISDGRFMTFDTDVPDTDVNVGANALLGVFYDRFLTVYDEEGNGVENVEVKLEDQIEGAVYSTPFFGGSDLTSDADGMVDSISCLQKYYDGSNTPQWGNNYLSLFYGDGDIPVSMNTMIDANNTDDLDVVLPDFDIPEEAVNVEAVTISHEQIDLSFEASPSMDIDHYEVWVNSGSGMMWDFNTTIPGTYPYMALIPDTTYSFKVISVDDDGLMSDGIVVANTTDPPVNGTIEGMIEYVGGPMDGMAAEAAMVVVKNSTGSELANMTTGVSGMYNFQEVPFGDNYIMTVYPFGYVQDGGKVSGYLVWSGPFDHYMDMMMNVSLEYYSYVSDDISGMVTYEGGPMNGMNAEDAIATLYNQTMVQIDQVYIGTDGMYLFEDVPFANGYTLKITPDNVVVDMGTVSGYLEKSLTFDHNGVTQNNVVLDYYEYIYVSDDIHGMVTYNGGPMDGMNATNATVHLLNESMVVIAEYTTNETGMFFFEDVEFGVNYSFRITPQDAAIDGGEVSGYIAYLSDLFNHTGMLEMDFELEYYEYIPPAPTTGPIVGQITYKDGAKDGQPMIGATVSIKNATGGYTNRTTNSTGHYKAMDMPFGPYTITVYPPAADEAVLNEKSGYLAEEFDAFTLNSATGVTMDYELVYYEYIPPVVEHPSLIIKDKDGNPIPGVFVTVTVGENIYTATTDADGKATFTELEGTTFPAGAKFEAEKVGYESLEWEGDTVPAMKEKKDKESNDSNLLLFIIIAVVVLVILIILFILIRNRGDDGGFEE